MSDMDRGAHRLDKEHMSQVSAFISSSANARMGGGGSMKQKLRWNLVYKDK